MYTLKILDLDKKKNPIGETTLKEYTKDSLMNIKPDANAVCVEHLKDKGYTIKRNPQWTIYNRGEMLKKQIRTTGQDDKAYTFELVLQKS